MKNFLIAFLFLPTLFFSQNNYPYNDLSREVLKTTLVVEITEGKTDDDKNINKAIIDVFEEHWTLTKVVFHTYDEINNLKKSNKSGYSFLSGGDYLREEVRTKKYIGRNGRTNYEYDYTAFTFSYFNYILEILDKGKLKTVLEIGLANGELTKIDYLYICQQVSNLLKSSSNNVPQTTFYNVAKNIKKIKSSKLILLKDHFREKDLKKMSSYYKYDFEVVDLDEYQDIILNKKENNLYAKIIWSNQNQIYVWVLVDAENGEIKSITAFGGIQFGRHHDANDIIKAKHLKYLTKAWAQKINGRFYKD